MLNIRSAKLVLLKLEYKFGPQMNTTYDYFFLWFLWYFVRGCKRRKSKYGQLSFSVNEVGENLSTVPRSRLWEHSPNSIKHPMRWTGERNTNFTCRLVRSGYSISNVILDELYNFYHIWSWKCTFRCLLMIE